MDAMLGSLGFQDYSEKMQAMAATHVDWQRLGNYVLRRREQLNLTQADVQAAGGPSVALLRQIERATQTSYRSSTLRDLERALRWEAGSVDAVLAGGEPTPTEQQTDHPGTGDADFDTLVAWLARVAHNNDRNPHLRAWARAQIAQLEAIRDADQAEAQARGEAAS